MIFAFHDCELDPDRLQLRREGELVHLEPKVLALLLHLIRSRDRVVPRQQLLDHLWPGTVVGDDSLANVVRKAREAVGDDGRSQQVIRTVHGVGYAFAAPIEERTASVPLGCFEAPSPFVGRERLMARLEAALDHCLAGHGRLVVLSGEAGIGKTRVADELARSAQRRGIGVHRAQGWEAEEKPTFWLWTQLLRSVIRELDPQSRVDVLGSGAAHIAEGLPLLRKELPELPELQEPTSLDPAQARFALFESVASLLCNLARQQPRLLIFDDLQWSRPESLELLDFLGLRLGEAPILVLAAYRDHSDLGDRMPSDIEVLLRRERTEQIHLTPLQRPDVERFIQELGGVAPSAAVVESIQDWSQGNPSFVRQLVEMLDATGRLGPAAEPDARPELRDAIPDRIREAIRRRLAPLEESERQLLEAAAVIGRSFPLDLLTRVAGVPREELVKILAMLRRSNVLRPLSEGRTVYEFVHVLLREVVYEDLPVAQRVARHHRVGEALEALHEGSLVDHLPALAHHFAEAALAGDVSKAVDYARRAGDRTMAACCYSEAIADYERGLALLDLGEDGASATRCDLYLALGHAQDLSGQDLQARESFLRAAEIARRANDLERLGSAALDAAGPSQTLRPLDRSAVALLKEALRTPGPKESALRVQLLSAFLTHLAIDPLRRKKLEPFARRVIEIARRLNDPVAVGVALASWVRALRMVDDDDLERRLALTDEARRIAERVEDRRLRAWVQSQRIATLTELGDMAGVEAALAFFARDANALGYPAWLWLESGYRAMRRAVEGRFEEAEKVLGEGSEHGLRLKISAGPLTLGCAKVLLQRDLGMLAEAEAQARGLCEAYAGHPSLRALLTLVLSTKNSIQEGTRELRALSADGFSAFVGTEGGKVALAGLAEASVRLGAFEHAEILYERLRAREGQCIVTGNGVVFLGPADLYLGLLASVRSDWEAADRHLEAAAAMSERIASPPWVARSLVGLGQMLLLRGALGDRGRALAALRRARGMAETLGMRPLAEEASRALEGMSLATAS